MERVRFGGTVGRTVEDSTPWWPPARRRAEGAPHLLLVALDAIGFADLGCFGSVVETPAVDRLAREGLRYTGFFGPSLGGAARACLLTGLDHHTVGMGWGAGPDLGFPGLRGRLAAGVPTLADLLRAGGYDTCALGRWDLAPFSTPRFAGGPLERGFDRFLGFTGEPTSEWSPVLVSGERYLEPPAALLGGRRHLTEILVDEAIRFVREQRAAHPERPFFLYLAPGACHAPHQAPRELAERHRGRFARGWDELRRQTLRRQRRLGLVPEESALAPRPAGIPPWRELSPPARALCERQAEVFAGVLAHADHQLRRLLSALDEEGAARDTLTAVVSTGGPSFLGGSLGALFPLRRLNGLPEPIGRRLDLLEELGGPRAPGLYAAGWALLGSTPGPPPRGGAARVPLVLHWPARLRRPGEVRRQFHHAMDLAPTLLEAAGLGPPSAPLEGTSLLYTADEEWAPTRRRLQSFEIDGERALWEAGCLARAHHPRGGDYAADTWTLTRAETDFAEADDLAAREPQRLTRMIHTWWSEAGRLGALPLDDRGSEKLLFRRPGARRRLALGPAGPLAPADVPQVLGRAHSLLVELERPSPSPSATSSTSAGGGADADTGADGVLVALGGLGAGFSLFVQGGRLVYDYNCAGEHFVVRSEQPLPAGAGPIAVKVRVDLAEEGAARVRLYAGGGPVGAGLISELLPLPLPEGEPLQIGRDAYSGVSECYQPPFAFGGTVRRVVIDAAEEAEAERAAPRHLH